MIFSERFDRALLFASHLHRRQTRKLGGVPYIAHLLSVAALVAEAGGTEDEAIAALLHDAVEDQGGLVTLEKIRRDFGDSVADVVEECSDSLVDAQTAGKAPWRERKEKYLAHLEHATPSGLLVSAADKLHNLRSLLAGLRDHGPELWSQFKGGPAGTLWYYEAVLDRLAARGAAPPLVQELIPLVAELRRRVETA